MAFPIYDVAFWRERLANAKEMGEIHRSVYHCSLGQWEEIENQHRKILADYIKPNDSILDAGCGYGRLINLLPESWLGDYRGVDLSEDFISLAKDIFPQREDQFQVANLNNLPFDHKQFDWAICVSIKQMVVGNKGENDWRFISNELHRVVKKVLILEYDAKDRGEIEL